MSNEFKLNNNHISFIFDTKEDLNIFTFSNKVITAFETSNNHYDALIAKGAFK